MAKFREPKMPTRRAAGGVHGSQLVESAAVSSSRPPEKAGPQQGDARARRTEAAARADGAAYRAYGHASTYLGHQSYGRLIAHVDYDCQWPGVFRRQRRDAWRGAVEDRWHVGRNC